MLQRIGQSDARQAVYYGPGEVRDVGERRNWRLEHFLGGCLGFSLSFMTEGCCGFRFTSKALTTLMLWSKTFRP